MEYYLWVASIATQAGVDRYLGIGCGWMAVTFRSSRLRIEGG
jgi:hypothetical protein